MNPNFSSLKLAIFSPNLNAYSETFIQAHKDLSFKIKFYFGGYLPNQLEAGKSLFEFSLKEKILLRIKRRLNFSERALYFSLKREGINCVLAEYGPTACDSLNVLKKLNLPLIVHFHGYDASNPEVIQIYRNRYKEMFQYAKTVFVVSEKMKKDVINLGCSSRKIEITRCGPHPSFFKNEPSLLSNQFLVVSRFVDIKGIIYTICAFKKILNIYPDSKLVLVGDGPNLESYKQLISALAINSSVQFLGVRNSKEIKELMNQSLAFVQHSITLEGGVTEGAPVAVMEAQASALPVITSDSGGIPDLVVNNETGFLVNEQDVEEMANCMIKVLEDRKLAAHLGQRGRERMKNYFSREKHLQQIEEAVLKANVS
jgi:glycosyltransferase involved in cell wall biosynthesis